MGSISCVHIRLRYALHHAQRTHTRVQTHTRTKAHWRVRIHASARARVHTFMPAWMHMQVFIAILSKGFDDRWDTKAERAAELTMKDAMFAWATRTTDAYRKEMKEQPDRMHKDLVFP